MAYSIITLLAGITGSYVGYGRTGSSYATGSISTEPFAGQTLVAFLTGASGDFIQLSGDTVATFLDTAVSVDGRVWTIAQPGVFAGGVTQYALTTTGAELTNGTYYSIATGSLGYALHAVTPSLIHGPNTSPALPDAVSEKRTFSTQRGTILSANARYMAIKVSVTQSSGWPAFLVVADGYPSWTNDVLIGGASFWSDFVIGSEDAVNGNRLVQFAGEATVPNEIEVIEAWYDAGANRWRGVMNGVAAEIDITGFNVNFNGMLYCMYDGGAMELHRSVVLDRVPTTDERTELRDFVTGPVPPVLTVATTHLTLHNTKLSIPFTVNQTVDRSLYGDDADKFELFGDTIRWVGDGVSDYNSPTDVGANNVYNVSLFITNPSTGLTGSRDLTITVDNLIFVGGQNYGRAGATGQATQNFVLTGGIDTVPRAGDFVVIIQHVGGTSDLVLSLTSGYTKQIEGFTDGTSYDSNLAVFTKFMGPTPDTNFTVGSSGSANNAQNCRVLVFRGVDPTTPFDIIPTLTQFTGTQKPDPPAIAGSTHGSAIIMAAGAAAATTAAWTAPAYLLGWGSQNNADTVDSVVGGGYRRWFTGDGSYNGAVWAGGGTANSGNASMLVHMALRPASGGAPPPVQLAYSFGIIM